MNLPLITAGVQYTNILLEGDEVVDDRLYRKGDAKIHRRKAGWLMKTACGINLDEEYIRLASSGLDHAEACLLCDKCFKSAEGSKLKRRLGEVTAEDAYVMDNED